MADQNVGAVIAGAVFLHDRADDDFLDRMIVDGGVDAILRHLRRQLIHAQGKNVEKAAHQIDVRMRTLVMAGRRIGSGGMCSGGMRRGGMRSGFCGLRRRARDKA